MTETCGSRGFVVEWEGGWRTRYHCKKRGRGKEVGSPNGFSVGKMPFEEYAKRLLTTDAREKERRTRRDEQPTWI